MIYFLKKFYAWLFKPQVKVLKELGIQKFTPLSLEDSTKSVEQVRQMLINFVMEKYGPKADKIISTASYLLLPALDCVILQIIGESHYYGFAVSNGHLERLKVFDENLKEVIDKNSGIDIDKFSVSLNYPYIVRRVCKQYPVEYVASEQEKLFGNIFTIVDPKSLVDGKLTSLARETLVATVSRIAISSKSSRLCVIFGEKDCIYCEPDGTTEASSQPPSEDICFFRSEE
jgi:hypothetical protein